MLKRFTSLFAVAVAALLVTAACSSAGTVDVADEVPMDDEVAVDDHAAEEVAEDDHAAEEDDHAAEEPGSVDRVLEVELTEFAFSVDSFVFAAGETVEFVITNSGVVPHEFRLSNQERVDKHLAGGHADHGDEDDDHSDGPADVVLLLEAGESGILVFTFPENDHDYTAVVCLIPGHYEAGMESDLSYST